MTINWQGAEGAARIERVISLLHQYNRADMPRLYARLTEEWGEPVTYEVLRGGLRRHGRPPPYSLCRDAPGGGAAPPAGDDAAVGPDSEPVSPTADTDPAPAAPEPVILDVPALAELRGLGGADVSGLDWDEDEDTIPAGTRPARPPAAPPAPGPAPYARLLDATRRGPVAFAELCDRLDMPPKRCRDLVERARADGIALEVAHDQVAFRLPDASDRVRDLGVQPVVGQRQHIGVISDTHLGSKYCLRAQLREFIHYAYEQGVREILHPGDVLDGCYKHGLFELTHSGIDAQTDDLFETLPALPGLTYSAIGGNHDDTFSDAIGMDAGQYVQNRFEASGRRDLKFYGRRGAYLKVRGAVVELWHPKKGPGYSLSYGLQNHVRDYAVGAKPDILLVGHWHAWVYLEQRGVHALACGTFQGGGSAFSKSLGGAPSMGGTLISWDLTADGTLRRVAVERSAYFEHEQPRETRDEREGEVAA